jgi:hypothetical protein
MPTPGEGDDVDAIGYKMTLKHEHGSDRDLDAAFMQIEDATDAYESMITNSADRTLTWNVQTTMTYDEVAHSNDPEFQGGSSASKLTVPPHPTGGSWAYGLLYIGQAWSFNQTADRWFYTRVDTGGGFASYKGFPTNIQKSSTQSRTRMHAVGFINAPGEGDEYEGRIWHNRNDVQSEDILGDHSGQYFAMELFT